MATNLIVSTAARNAACNALVDLLDAGTGSPKIQLYTGTQPASPATAPSGTLLVEFTLNGTAAFGNASNGTASLVASPALTATAVGTGTATWFRALDRSGTAVFIGSVGTSSADLVYNTTSIVSGNTCELTGLTFTIPAS